MKYTNEITLNLPAKKAADLFVEAENFSKWQPGFIKYENVSGEHGEPGSVTKLWFKMGKREMIMTEKTISNNLPESIVFEYSTKSVRNIVETHFKAIEGNKTKCITENEFNFGGVMKLMGWLMPGAFKKQTQKYMEEFKAFAEKA